MPMIDPLYSLSGLAVGLLVGMTGVGGGSLMTPIFILLFGIHPAPRSAPISSTRRRPRPEAAWCMVSRTASTGAWCGAWRRQHSGDGDHAALTLHFNLNGEAARGLITLVLSIALFATAFVLVFGGRSSPPIVRACRGRFGRTAVGTVVVGALLGVLVSISSVGAGAIGVVRWCCSIRTCRWLRSSAPTSPTRCH